MFDAKGANALEFFFGEDLADGIVAAGVSCLPSSDMAETLRGVQNLTQVRSRANVQLEGTYNHSCFGIDRVLQFLEVYCPLGGRRGSGRPVLGRMEGNIADFSAGHLDVTDIPGNVVSKIITQSGRLTGRRTARR